jgi:hypothetical protein
VGRCHGGVAQAAYEFGVQVDTASEQRRGEGVSLGRADPDEPSPVEGRHLGGSGLGTDEGGVSMGGEVADGVCFGSLVV